MRKIYNIFGEQDCKELSQLKKMTRRFALSNGGIAQLVERLNGIQKVSGSRPLISTKTRKHAKLKAFFYGKKRERRATCDRPWWRPAPATQKPKPVATCARHLVGESVLSCEFLADFFLSATQKVPNLWRPTTATPSGRY